MYAYVCIYVFICHYLVLFFCFVKLVFCPHINIHTHIYTHTHTHTHTHTCIMLSNNSSILSFHSTLADSTTKIAERSRTEHTTERTSVSDSIKDFADGSVKQIALIPSKLLYYVIHTYVCTYIHTCIHTHIHNHIHTHTPSHTCIHTHMHMYTHRCTCMHKQTRTHAHTHTHTHTQHRS